MRRALAGFLFLLVLADPACKAKKESDGPLDPSPLRVEPSGCAAIVVEEGADGCVLPDDREIRIFVPSSTRGGDRVDVMANDAIAPHAPPIAMSGGTLHKVTPPLGTGSLVITRTSADGSRAIGKLPLSELARPSWFKTAQDLRQKGKLEEASALAEPALETAPSVATRAAAEGILARIALRRGKIDEAVRLFKLALQHDEEAGLISDRVDDALALVFLLHKRTHRYAEARKVLEEATRFLDRYPDGRAREPLYRGQVEWETGDTHAATRLLDVSIERATTLGAASIARAARQVRAMVACTAGTRRACLGALTEADRELEQAKDATICERAEVAISLGFAKLEDRDARGFDPFYRALGKDDDRGLVLLDSGCPDTYMRAVATEHLALAAVFEQDPEKAKARLADAKKWAPEPRIPDAIMWHDIEGRIAELEKKPDEAIAAQKRARLLAESSALRTQAWRAATSLGRLFEAKGARDEALRMYTAAEAILDEVVALVPLGEGRAGAAADGAESMRRLVSLLVANGKAKEALDVFRHARTRLVRSLAITADLALLGGAERAKWDQAVAEYRGARTTIDDEAANDWKLSERDLDLALRTRADKLAALRARLDDAMVLVASHARMKEPPPLPETDLTFALARLGPLKEVVGFVVDHGKVRAIKLGNVIANGHKDPLAEQLLGPITPELEHATRLRILADDSLASIDFHALPFQKHPLVTRMPVVYGVDLETRLVSDAKLKPAVVVADPTGDLPAAREEGAAVARALGGAQSLVGKDASAKRVREELEQTLLFHYAGHGSFKGRDGAESALPLAQGGALSFGDVLALRRGPRLVILSGCETGREEGVGQEATASLAQAFLVAGAETVIAPVRVVDDQKARSLAVDLHADRDGGERDLAALLAQAQARAYRDGREGWESFRAFVR